jgi:hypothetical protein
MLEQIEPVYQKPAISEVAKSFLRTFRIRRDIIEL